MLGIQDVLQGGVDGDGRTIDHTPKSVACWVIGAGLFLYLFHEVGGFRVVVGAGKT